MPIEVKFRAEGSAEPLELGTVFPGRRIDFIQFLGRIPVVECNEDDTGGVLGVVDELNLHAREGMPLIPNDWHILTNSVQIIDPKKQCIERGLEHFDLGQGDLYAIAA